MAARFRRHDLVWLSREGWLHLMAQPHEGDVLGCLQHWWSRRLPLVVGRQEPGRPELALGLAAPLEWGRRKIAVHAPRGTVLYHDRFPRAADIARLLPTGLRARWIELAPSLAKGEVDARVHGSYGWQCVTGMRYLTARSDIDLLLPVCGLDHADAVAARLEAMPWAGPRIDGELLFPNGSAVAWREWLQWRRGAVDRIMVKRLHGVSLEQGTGWLEHHRPVPA